MPSFSSDLCRGAFALAFSRGGAATSIARNQTNLGPCARRAAGATLQAARALDRAREQL